MGPKEAAQALALIQPKAAIPIHYATFGLLTGTAEEFVEHAHSTPVHPLKPGETLRF
jgi:L-ascorbate metabolism protein UlaG (beta-lactamase superfamily)